MEVRKFAEAIKAQLAPEASESKLADTKVPDAHTEMELDEVMQTGDDTVRAGAGSAEYSATSRTPARDERAQPPVEKHDDGGIINSGADK